MMSPISKEAVVDGRDVAPLVPAFQVPITCHYDWGYRVADAHIAKLYQLGKRLNWNAELDINWDQRLPPATTEVPADFVCEWSSFGPFDTLSGKAKVQFLTQYNAWAFSQTLHGEQGALLVASQLVSNAPTIDAKLFAASQAFDEARHVEAFKKYIALRFDRLYPITPSLRSLLDKILTDARWDIKFIGMQMIIENLALASFNQLKVGMFDPVLQSVLNLVTRDESRHVAFGIEYLEKFVAGLSPTEREERARFAYEACCVARENLKPFEVWRQFGWALDEADRFFMTTPTFKNFQKLLFTRIMPHIQRIGLLTENIAPKYATLGVLGYGDAANAVEIDWAELERPLARGSSRRS